MISRRQFIGTLPLMAIRPHEDASNGAGALVDLTRCIGCRACENACLVRAGFDGLPANTIGYAEGEGRLTYRTRTVVQNRVKLQCMHCLEPACVSVCPVAALEKTSAGPVMYHESICIGCRYCILACPFNVPKYEWDNALLPRVGKCDFCADRQAKGQSPACVAACPTGALKFGKRADLLKEAKARMNAQPRRYETIYGEEEVGGTSWIYLGAGDMGLPKDLPKQALPNLTWKAISKVPFVVIGVGLILSAIVRWRTREQC